MDSKGIFSKLLTGGLAGAALMSTVYVANPNVAIADKTTISETKDGFSQTNSKDAPFEIYNATISGRPANGHIYTEDSVKVLLQEMQVSGAQQNVLSKVGKNCLKVTKCVGGVIAGGVSAGVSLPAVWLYERGKDAGEQSYNIITGKNIRESALILGYDFLRVLIGVPFWAVAGTVKGAEIGGTIAYNDEGFGLIFKCLGDTIEELQGKYEVNNNNYK